jgi:hypothetical protein
MCVCVGVGEREREREMMMVVVVKDIPHSCKRVVDHEDLYPWDQQMMS